jgi:hypothetical protein
LRRNHFIGIPLGGKKFRESLFIFSIQHNESIL